MLVIRIFTCLLLFTGILYFLMNLLITAGCLLGRKKSSGKTDILKYFSAFGQGQIIKKPLHVTIIIPVRNEAANIIPCLDGLYRQDYLQSDFEVLVSDDFSEDHTPDFVSRWIMEHWQFNITLIEGKENSTVYQGKKKAIERALKIAKGEVIITTDADTSHQPSWISGIVKAFGNEQTRMVLGPVGFSDGQSLFDKIQVLEFLGIMGITMGSANLGIPLMCNGANIAYRKKDFETAGGFSGNNRFLSGDDQFLLLKFRKQFGGKSIRFLKDQDIVTLTKPCATWHEFWEQRIRWAAKSRGYHDSWVLSAGLIIYCLAFMIFAGILISLFYPLVLLLVSSVFLVKLITDYPMVWLMAGFFGKRKILNYYFIAQLFQICYMVFAGIAALFRGYSWKGRHAGI